MSGIPRAKIFVLNDSGHDFTPAEDFGELVVLSEGTISKYNLTEMLRMLSPITKDSAPDDFILQSGPAVMNGVACAAFAAKHGCLNLLIWKADRRNGDHYVHRRLKLR